MRRIVVSVLTVAVVVGALAGAAAASQGGSADNGHRRSFTLLATNDAFQNFSTTKCCESNPGDYFVEHFKLTGPGGGPAGGVDDTCLLTFGNHGQHALCQYAIDLTGRGVIHASGLFLSIHPDGQGGFLPDAFDAAVTGGTAEFVGARGVIHLTFPSHEQTDLAVALR